MGTIYNFANLSSAELPIIPCKKSPKQWEQLQKSGYNLRLVQISPDVQLPEEASELTLKQAKLIGRKD